MVGKWDEWGVAGWTNLSPFMEEEQQLKWAPLVFAETSKFTSEELVCMSVEYSKRGRLEFSGRTGQNRALAQQATYCEKTWRMTRVELERETPYNGTVTSNPSSIHVSRQGRHSASGTRTTGTIGQSGDRPERTGRALGPDDKGAGRTTQDRNRHNAFDQGDVTALEVLGNQVGTAIENARLFQETKHRYEAMVVATKE